MGVYETETTNMTTEQASKLRNGQVVTVNDPKETMPYQITVEKSQILLSDMSVILTTDDGREIKCKADQLVIV